MDAPENDFVRRIRDYRTRGAAAREAAERSLEKAAAEMARRVGALRAFASMDSAAFPVSTGTERSSADIPEPQDQACLVTAVMREDGCHKIVMQARSGAGDDTASLTLSMGGGTPIWHLECFSRSVDGGEYDQASEHRHADDALAAFTARALATVQEAIAGRDGQKPARFQGSETADARVSREAVRAAQTARATQEEGRARRRDELLRAGGAIRAAWGNAARELSFLGEIGYAFDGTEGDGVFASATAYGLRVRVACGECAAEIAAEAAPSDPRAVSISVSDAFGRREHRTVMDTGDTEALARELADAVLDEVEAAEAVWLPAIAPEYGNESFPSM